MSEYTVETQATQSGTTKIVSAYLKSLGALKNHSKTRHSLLKQKLAKAENRIVNLDGGIAKLKLHTTIEELKRKIKDTERAHKSLESHKTLEAQFVGVAAQYTSENNTPASAWKALGVPHPILIEAGLIKARQRRATN